MVECNVKCRPKLKNVNKCEKTNENTEMTLKKWCECCLGL